MNIEASVMLLDTPKSKIPEPQELGTVKTNFSSQSKRGNFTIVPS